MTQCEACRHREFEICEVGVDANGELMACKTCSRLKKRCRYSNGGKGRRKLRQEDVVNARTDTTKVARTSKDSTDRPAAKSKVSTSTKGMEMIVEIPVKRRGKNIDRDHNTDEERDAPPPRKKAKVDHASSKAPTSGRRQPSEKSGSRPQKGAHRSRTPIEVNATPSPIPHARSPSPTPAPTTPLPTTLLPSTPHTSTPAPPTPGPSNSLHPSPVPSDTRPSTPLPTTSRPSKPSGQSSGKREKIFYRM